MKVLFAADLVPNPDSGAAGTELETIQGLRRMGHEVDEIWATDLGRRIAHGNLHYLVELPCEYRKAIRSRLLQHAYDVIHANQSHCFLAAKEFKQKKTSGVFISRSHGLEEHMESVLKKWRKKIDVRNRSFIRSGPGIILDRLLRRHLKLAIRYVDGFIVSSSMDRKYLVEEYGIVPDRVACIPQAPSGEFVAREPMDCTSAKLRRILFVAGHGYFKGPNVMAEVANRLLPARGDVQLTWVTDASSHKLVAKLLTKSAREKVRLHDFMPKEELLNVYDSHGIFVFPSYFEGFGKVFLEAMARGLCVIATPTGGVKDILDDGQNGFLVPFGNADAIVERIQFLLANESVARDISRNAAVKGRNYSWDRVSRETTEFYEHLLRKIS